MKKYLIYVLVFSVVIPISVFAQIKGDVLVPLIEEDIVPPLFKGDIQKGNVDVPLFKGDIRKGDVVDVPPKVIIKGDNLPETRKSFWQSLNFFPIFKGDIRKGDTDIPQEIIVKGDNLPETRKSFWQEFKNLFKRN